ncbi:succinylglutamate desuccinylase/aspartoacylase family protein [Lutibacter sp.]|uniref:succinylglutamate desuccinylase/aspartoacylase family protein n=1 Tax=Lutibacter sp. TaxID=1925666 RepID=UPI002732DF0C|nr:succinylglutamate desuccinylase/aspartoacylase family protein [Lutibacter sp.]MDP3313873.1 succinylglutamate desuccinylase/aspartoacylase family protein [Lutibacter sp.]
MKILNHKIGLGESVQVKMDFARLNTRSIIEVPIIVERAKVDGPCILLLGGVHGDEINGIEIVRQIVAKGYNKPEKGTVICIPLLNVFGFLNQRREFPDGRDLNRVFPGSITGSLASRFAFHIMKEVVPHIDVCIDYHTGGAQRFNYSQIRIDDNDPENLKLAQVFGAPFILFSQSKDRTIRKSMTNLGKKVLLFEGGKSFSLDKNVTQSGIQGALNIMNHLGIRDFNGKVSRPTLENASIIIKKSKWIRAKHSGMYRSFVSAGQKVERGIKIGSISDPFGTFEQSFKNTQTGYILNSNHAPVVNQGDALFHIGYE